jgi:acetylornithine deacetylase/succinyl-diaminopimelate desuccinylase-like protein
MRRAPQPLSIVIPVCLAITIANPLSAQSRVPQWQDIEPELLRHFQALVRMDTSDPPGQEELAADYLVAMLQQEQIPVQVFTRASGRPNVVARLSGNGSREPLLLMAHTDVVSVDPAKWTHPPFSAMRDGDHIYGRGTLDDKDSVATALTIMLLLKRFEIPLDRDVIFLAEAGEEINTSVGIEFMVTEHYDEIEAEYCIAEAGGVRRRGGEVQFATVETLEKIPRAVQLTATGPAGHGSVPQLTNPVVRLAAAVTAVANWQAPVRTNETTATYFRRLARLSSAENANRYRAAVGSDPDAANQAAAYFLKHEPRHSSMLRTSISPTIIDGGYQVNVIPGEATATLDVRMLPDEDPALLLETLQTVISDPLVTVSYIPRDTRPVADNGPLDSQPFKIIQSMLARHYETTTLPTMSTGATDMAYLRDKGMRCYGVGPATDVEDAPLGFAAHSDQERILEDELYRFLRFYWDVVVEIAGTR